MITRESSGCCSTAHRNREPALFGPTSSQPGHGLRFKQKDAERAAA